MTATYKSAAIDNSGGRFLRKIDWSAFWTACVAAFAVYFCTLAPTVTLEDSGELAVAADYLGVPHPPGYPIWTMLAWAFAKLFAFVTFRGQPNPAWGIGLMSAVFGSLTAGMAAMLICRSGSDMLRESRQTLHEISPSTRDLICWTGGVVGSLLFAFSPVMWSQCVIVEVYSLNAFFLVLIFLLTYQWMCRPSDKMLYLTAFVFGLGLTNYQVLLLAALPLVIVIMLKDIKLFRDFMIVGCVFAAVIGLIRIGKLPPISHPTHLSCYVYVSLNFLVLALACFCLPRGKTVALTLLLAELGVAFYAYMPIVSDLRNPPMNWGYPQTWEGFKHVVTRSQYEGITPADVFSARFIGQIGAYLTELRVQFTLPVALLGFLPFSVWQAKISGRRVKAAYVATCLCLFASVILVIEKILLSSPTAETVGGVVWLYKLPIWGVIIILTAGVVALLVGQAKQLVLRATGRTCATTSERFTSALILLGMAGLFLFYAVMLTGKLGDITAPLRQSGESITGTQLKPVLLQATGILLLVILPLVLLLLVSRLMWSRYEFRITIDDNSQKWLVAILFGFVAMSIILVVLANPTGDIEDQFIQRVKFISSHALYSFWIGYGLIFGLVCVATILRGSRTVRWLSLTAATVLPLVPIQQNLFNSELIRRYGGAEQGGHYFGWQFGNYQLRGAEAISEELDPEEEPLPNPAFPAEVKQDAIFFGGTDPGRFVTKYMIYCAGLRKDVYLITQSAFADKTYVSATRDLYGDRIWIPAESDIAKAYSQYAEEVRTGKRRGDDKLKTEDARVTVSGQKSLMQINGILAQMVFEHNKHNHNFYVEEGYIEIPWMYPFLAPHGLMMKLNRSKTKLTQETVRNDADFWDWQTRRLMCNRKFLRDFVARKAFSKLRTAIAGVYVSRGELQEAERAYQQAIMLYPLNAEANFKLVRDVYLPLRRFSEAKELITEERRQDPGKSQLPNLLREIKRTENFYNRMAGLEAEMSKETRDVNKAIELAAMYQRAGRIPEFMNLTGSILSNTNLPPIFHFRVAKLLAKAGKTSEMANALDQCITRISPDTPADVFVDMRNMYAKARQPEKMHVVMEEYLKRQPTDWKSWLELAALRIELNRTKAAISALEEALRTGGNEALSVVSKDRRFAAIRAKAISRAGKLTVIARPGSD